MEPISQQFELLALTESKDFRLILDIMYHTKKEDGKRLLNMMNNVIDNLLAKSKQNNEDINLQIVHLPSCPDWARELLIRFTIHKIALTANKISVDRFARLIQTTIRNNDSKQVKQIQFRNRYYRKLSRSFKDIITPNNNHKSLIITKEQDLIANRSDKNPWLQEFFTDAVDENDHNLILSTNDTAFDLEGKIRTIEKSNIPTIENIFIFHSLNRSKITNSYNKGQLQRLNRHGLGIRNCIVFSFSDQPFKLYHTIDNVKYRLASSLLNKDVVKHDDFEGFTTFTQKEIDFLFKHKVDSNQETFLVDCEGRFLFTTDIDQILDQLPHNLRYKNNLSLSFNENLQDSFIKSISQEIKGFSKDLYSDYFNLLKQLWQDEIQLHIEAFLKGCSSIGFVLPKGINKNIKDSLLALFQKNSRTIRCYSMEDIAKGINAEKLIVFQYRYTNKFHKVYPNSFDPLPLKSKQQALKVINLLTHSNYFDWNMYWYKKDLNQLLFSAFRTEELAWEKKIIKRPTHPNVIDFIHEDESEAKKYQTEKCKVYYKDESRPKECFANERVLYKENNSFRITELKDIANLENIDIQMLDSIIEQVKILISEKSEDKTKTEYLLRKDPKYNLSESEINSSVELWKILLKRRVDISGESAVYDAIFASTPINDRISLNTFSQWCNLENSMILPRSRKHQIALLTYLGFELRSPYPIIMVAKKISNINNSRFLNSQIETLLQKTLADFLTERKFELLSQSHCDIFTLLDINKMEDINALIDLLEISLTPIKRIEYDQN